MKKLEFRKIILPNLIILIIFLGVYIASFISIKNENVTVINNEIASFVETIKNQYPNVKEEEIIEKLQTENKREVKINYLEKYGYDNKEIYSKTINKYINKLLIIYLIITILLIATFIIFFIIINRKREKKIEELIKYIKDISNKIYTLKIEENSEDELSKLSNELYKITILLKESAENTKKENENLTKSLEDISHQLKTPLTSIRILLDNIAENPEMDNKTRSDFLNLISKQVDLISNLVISILNLAKFDSGTIKMNNKEFKIIDLLNLVKEDLAILIEIKNINLIIKGDIDAKLVADYKWQKEAISNIIKNAIEHSKENSKLFITIEDSSLFLEIIIKDEGEGINKKDLKHIFERFYKSENASEESIGIGLAFAKTVIEKNNGYIFVDSKENEGTTFKIRYLK